MFFGNRWKYVERFPPWMIRSFWMTSFLFISSTCLWKMHLCERAQDCFCQIGRRPCVVSQWLSETQPAVFLGFFCFLSLGFALEVRPCMPEGTSFFVKCELQCHEHIFICINLSKRHGWQESELRGLDAYVQILLIQENNRYCILKDTFNSLIISTKLYC